MHGLIADPNVPFNTLTWSNSRAKVILMRTSRLMRFIQGIVVLTLLAGVGVASAACMDCEQPVPVAHQHGDATCGHEKSDTIPEAAQHSCACHCHIPSGLVEGTVHVLENGRCMVALTEVQQTLPLGALTEIEYPPIFV